MTDSKPPQGWQCPMCKNVFSPLVTMCPVCAKAQAESNKLRGYGPEWYQTPSKS